MASYYVTTTGNDTTGDGSSGNPWATPGKAGGSLAVDDILYIAEGTYTITSSTANISGGRLALPANVACHVIGHATGDTTDLSATPVISAGAITGISIISLDGADGEVQTIINIKVDGAKGTSNIGFNGTGASQEYCIKCEAINCPIQGFDAVTAIACKSSYTTTKTGAGFNLCRMELCWADHHEDGTTNATGVSIARTVFSNCIDGVDAAGNYRTCFTNCVAYNCVNSGFQNRNTATIASSSYINCIAYENGLYGWDFNVLSGCGLVNCASGENTSGRTDGNEAYDIGAVTLTADPFTNATGGDFSLNNTAGGGALCRQLGIGILGQTPGPSIGAVEFAISGGGFSGSIFQPKVIR